MEAKYLHSTNGQSVYEEDLNLLGLNSALADDRVFAELLRLAPMTGGGKVVRGILPYRVADWETSILPGACVVQPSTGGVVVKPFRAVVGSRTAVGAGTEKDNWRDIRTALMLGASALDSTVTLAATTGAVQRNDMIYAAVTVDANAATVNRKVKDPTTGQITTATVVTQKNTTVALGVVKGADNDSTIPSLPTDMADTYYIAIAVVHVPTSFGPAVLLSSNMIYECATVPVLSESTGACTARPAEGQFKISGAVNQNYPWAFSNRKPAHMPPTMVGSEDILVAFDLTSAIGPHFSHVSGDIVDQTRDWSKRIWTWQVCAIAGGSTPKFPWEYGSAAPFVPSSACVDGSGKAKSGFGQSMVQDYGSGTAGVMHVTPTELTDMNATSSIDLYVDLATGALKIDYANTPNVKGFIWLRASAQYGNAR